MAASFPVCLSTGASVSSTLWLLLPNSSNTNSTSARSSSWTGWGLRDLVPTWTGINRQKHTCTGTQMYRGHKQGPRSRAALYSSTPICHLVHLGTVISGLHVWSQLSRTLRIDTEAYTLSYEHAPAHMQRLIHSQVVVSVHHVCVYEPASCLYARRADILLHQTIITTCFIKKPLWFAVEGFTGLALCILCFYLYLEEGQWSSYNVFCEFSVSEQICESVKVLFTCEIPTAGSLATS